MDSAVVLDLGDVCGRQHTRRPYREHFVPIPDQDLGRRNRRGCLRQSDGRERHVRREHGFGWRKHCDSQLSGLGPAAVQGRPPADR